MGAIDAGGLSRPRWHAYLLLSRLSNLPTIWTNVLAGTVAASTALAWGGTLTTIAAASLFYTGGMFLNDAFDEAHDRQFQPARPVPAGDVSRAEAFIAGGVMLALAETLLLRHDARTAVFGLVLAACIVLYDARHKGHTWAPLVMGACRSLVYLVAASAAGGVTGTAWAGAIIAFIYVVALTVVAKRAGPDARWIVPLLIAGISIVDAIFIALVTHSPAMTLLAASAFAVTLFLQRVVPGD
jgi:4-hydroxybenzoate polyprenyltransferase